MILISKKLLRSKMYATHHTMCNFIQSSILPHSGAHFLCDKCSQPLHAMERGTDEVSESSLRVIFRAQSSNASVLQRVLLGRRPVTPSHLMLRASTARRDLVVTSGSQSPPRGSHSFSSTLARCLTLACWLERSRILTASRSPIRIVFIVPCPEGRVRGM